MTTTTLAPTATVDQVGSQANLNVGGQSITMSATDAMALRTALVCADFLEKVAQADANAQLLAEIAGVLTSDMPVPITVTMTLYPGLVNDGRAAVRVLYNGTDDVRFAAKRFGVVPVQDDDNLSFTAGNLLFTTPSHWS